MLFATLDDPTVRAAASADPAGFVGGLDRTVIDEAQRTPDLLPSMETAVDANSRS